MNTVSCVLQELAVSGVQPFSPKLLSTASSAAGEPAGCLLGCGDLGSWD